MRVTLLGTGGPRPDPARQGPATLVTASGRQLLFDAGRGVATQLVRAGLAIEDVDTIFLTHHHYDHIGGLGDLLMAMWNNGRSEPIAVVGPKGTAALVETLIGAVYATDIRFRHREAAAMGGALVDMRDMVHGVDVTAGAVHHHQGVVVTAEEVDHGSAIGFAEDEWMALGFRVDTADEAVAISGDAVSCPGLDSLARGVDVLVLCCYLAGAEIDSPHAEFLASNVLASARDVGRISARAGAGKLVLTHLRQKGDDLLASIVDDARRDYSAPIVIGEDLLVVDI